METLVEINNQIEKVVAKKKKLFDDALDGRSQRWLSEKTGITETRLSKCIAGVLTFEQDELNLINDALGASFTLDA